MTGNKIFLDTNILIYYLQEREEVLFSLIEFNDILVSVISKIELLGYHSISAVEEEQIEHFLSTVELIQLNDQISDIAIDLRKKYRMKTPDSIIVATAIYCDATLVTADRQLSKVADITVIRYGSE